MARGGRRDLLERVFDPQPATLWGRVLRSLGGPYAVMANVPADPEMN